MSKVAICTISSHNYMAYGLTCLLSAGNFNEGSDLFYLVADEYNSELYKKYEDNVKFVNMDELDIKKEKLVEMEFKYNIVEFNTAIKPKFYMYLLSKGYDTVIYLDPDIECYASFSSMLEQTKDASIIVTPHKMTTHNSKHIDDSAFLNNGIYNLGFIAMNNCKETLRFLEWWNSKLEEQCYLDYLHGMATDQIWVELASTIFDGIHVLKDWGMNVAYWNIDERNWEYKNGICSVNQQPLVFFHFSSMSISCNQEFLKEIDADNPGFYTFYVEHIKRVKENDLDKFSNIPYKFASYEDGSFIEQEQRWLYGFSEYLKNIYANPFISGKNSYRTFIESRKSSKHLKAHSSDEKLLLLMIKVLGMKKSLAFTKKLSISIIQRIAEMFC